MSLRWYDLQNNDFVPAKYVERMTEKAISSSVIKNLDRTYIDEIENKNNASFEQQIEDEGKYTQVERSDCRNLSKS